MVKNTIIDFIKQIVVDQEQIIVFTCETSDRKQLCQNRKFNAWFTLSNIEYGLGCEKHDSNSLSFDDDVYYASMIILSDHPLRQNYIDAFISDTDPATYNK